MFERCRCLAIVAVSLVSFLSAAGAAGLSDQEQRLARVVDSRQSGAMALLEAAVGIGIIDMKGGNVVIVEALAALKAVGALEDLDVTVVMTGDEESSGRPLSAARKALLDVADAADIARGLEDGDGDPETDGRQSALAVNV